MTFILVVKMLSDSQKVILNHDRWRNINRLLNLKKFMLKRPTLCNGALYFLKILIFFLDKWGEEIGGK